MKKLKNLFCILLTLVLCFSSLSAFAISDKNALTVLDDLGIMEKNFVPYFKPAFTREAFAQALTKMLNADASIEYAESLASDSDKGYVNYVVDMNLMELDEEGKFNPKGNLTYDVAIKAFVRLLGYSYEGCDYQKLARSLGIMEKVVIEDFNRLQHDEVAKMIINVLPIVRVVHTENQQIELSSLLEQLELTHRAGRILANDNLGVTSVECEDGYVNIDGVIYKADIAITDDMVGRSVHFYTKRINGDEVVVSIYTEYQKEAIVINAADYNGAKIDGSGIEINYGDNEKVRIPHTANIIVNSRPNDITLALLSKFDCGEIYVLDSDNDGDYDFVNMIFLKTDIVLNASSWYERVTTQYLSEKVELSKLQKDVTVYKNGEKATFADIKSGDIIGIACDKWKIEGGEVKYDYTKAQRISLYLSDRTVVGDFSAIDDDGAYTINDRVYRVNNIMNKVKLSSEKPDLVLGESYIFKLDYFGAISDFEEDKNGSVMEYGYLIKSGLDGVLNKKLQSKILTVDNKVEIFDYSDRFKLNGSTKKVSDFSATPTALDNRQVIRYKLNYDGKISKIETADAIGSSLKKDGTTFSTESNSYGEEEYTEKLSGFADFRTRVSSNTVAFFVPLPDATDIEDGDFTAGSSELFINGTSYKYDAYDIKEMGITGCMVAYASGTEIADTSRYYMVGKIKGTPDGEIMELYGYEGKITASFDAGKVVFKDRIDIPGLKKADETEIPGSFANVKKGDLIKVSLNSRKEILSAVRVFSIDNPISFGLPNTGYDCGYALLYDHSDEFFEFVVDKDFDNLHSVTPAERYNAPFMKVAFGSIPVYDMREDTITAVSSDFTKIPDFKNNGEKVTIHMFWSSQKEMWNIAAYIWE